MKKHKPHHRQYTIKQVPGQHLNLYKRIFLARDWNAATDALTPLVLELLGIRIL